MKTISEVHNLHEERTHLAELPLAPLDDRVIVRILEEEERVTKGGVALPKSTEIPQRGLVMAVGPGAVVDSTVQWDAPLRRPLQVKPGDVVYFARYAGIELRVDEEDYLALRERDIIAVDCRYWTRTTTDAEGHA